MKNILVLAALLCMALCAQAQSEPDFCWTDSQTRGAGKFPTGCPAGQELDAGLCYPKCQTGYVGVGPVCWGKCPAGYNDAGAFCGKPASYGRGVGYVTEAKCKSATGKVCEKTDGLWYPKCKENFHNVGCCTCSPDCPPGFTDGGATCNKPSYGRGVGNPPSKCENGLVNNAGLCYPACPAGFKGVGPVCWSTTCPAKLPTKCGLGCAKSASACAANMMDQITAPLEMIANIVGMVLSGGGTAVAKQAAVTSAKTIAKATIKSQIKQRAIQLGKTLAEDALENAASIAYEAQLTGEFSWADLDPTGIANVVMAFNKPLCKNIH